MPEPRRRRTGNPWLEADQRERAKTIGIAVGVFLLLVAIAAFIVHALKN